MTIFELIFLFDKFLLFGIKIELVFGKRICTNYSVKSFDLRSSTKSIGQKVCIEPI